MSLRSVPPPKTKRTTQPTKTGANVYLYDDAVVFQDKNRRSSDPPDPLDPTDRVRPVRPASFLDVIQQLEAVRQEQARVEAERSMRERIEEERKRKFFAMSRSLGLDPLALAREF